MLNHMLNSRNGIWWWLAFVVVLWTLVPLLSNVSVPLDTLEIIAWGREWPLGLYRHPPVKVWLMEIFYTLTGGWTGSAYLLSTIAFAVSQYAIYVALRDVVHRSFALTAILFSQFIFYFTVGLPQWNANIAQFPFAGLFVLSIWRALERRTLNWWFLAGLFAGLGFITKYSFALIPVCVAAVALFRSDLRSRLHVGGIAIMVVAGLVTIAPNLSWLAANWELATTYAEGRLASGHSSVNYLLGPLAAIGMGFGSFFLLFFLARTLVERHGAPSSDAPVDRLAWVFGAASIGPFLVGAVIAARNGVVLKDEWFMANLLFMPGFALLKAARGWTGQVRWKRFAIVFFWSVVAISALGYPANRWEIYLRKPGYPWLMAMPMKPLADEGLALWRKSLAERGGIDRPLRIVAGGAPAAGTTPYLPGRPHWLERFSSRFSPWVTKDDIRRDGVLLIGDIRSVPAELKPCVAASETYQWHDMMGTPREKITLAVVLPADLCPESGSR